MLGKGEDSGECRRVRVREALPCERADDHQRSARSVRRSIGVQPRLHLIVEAAAVVPGDEQGGRSPFRSVHDRRCDLAHPVVSGRHREAIVLAERGVLSARRDDGEVGQVTGPRVLDEGRTGKVVRFLVGVQTLSE